MGQNLNPEARQRGERIERWCPTCAPSSRRGLLWMGGGDYLRCPDCNGTGTFTMYEQLKTPPRHFLVQGLKP